MLVLHQLVQQEQTVDLSSIAAQLASRCAVCTGRLDKLHGILERTEDARSFGNSSEKPTADHLESRCIAYELLSATVGLHMPCDKPSFSLIERHMNTFCRLEHNIAAEHRKFVLPAFDFFVRLQDSYDCVCHFCQGEILACKARQNCPILLITPNRRFGIGG